MAPNRRHCLSSNAIINLLFPINLFFDQIDCRHHSLLDMYQVQCRMIVVETYTNNLKDKSHKFLVLSGYLIKRLSKKCGDLQIRK